MGLAPTSQPGPTKILRETTDHNPLASNPASAYLLLQVPAFKNQAGAGGFRDFPPLPAAKENRTGSRRTLPVTLSLRGFPIVFASTRAHAELAVPNP
ncbi:hypothetical protein SBA5_30109 [Candidatus Sulfotelmatomonas gaucii]|uniref:Uncharacterized protein n=1 Tax=Candidatus Sulfuritelmatomonas gaucii TaxID=2043161 RepID=A0A2N9LCX3_9BACT|nr:hypothetical protein SBA5_30109 [Candidatus Sulfotelmatomonas gaucii]